jgi:hypothetical protein
MSSQEQDFHLYYEAKVGVEKILPYLDLNMDRSTLIHTLKSMVPKEDDPDYFIEMFILDLQELRRKNQCVPPIQQKIDHLLSVLPSVKY